jgi:GNAT superfamily N-acetyltransferase
MISVHKLQPGDEQLIDLVAAWYFEEWHIPIHHTQASLSLIVKDAKQLQLVLLEGNTPVATGGIYHHVGLLDREPHLAVHKHWLARVYTLPGYRSNGYGAELCKFLHHNAQIRGLKTLHLFTDTAESFYQKLGWQVQERLETAGRTLTVMCIELN